MRAQGGGRRTTLIIAAAVLVVPLAVLYFLTGSATNVLSWRELLPAPAHRYVVGFFGLLADGFGGIPFQAPFYLFGLFAITRWRSTPRGFRSGVLAGALYILYLLPRPEWYGGWAPPLRYLVFLMPVLALGAASVWDRISRGAIAIAAVWTIGVTVHGLAYPYRLFHIANGETPAGEWLSHLYQSDFSRLIPSFIRPNEARWIGVAVVLALVTIGLRRWKHDLAIPLFALALAVGFTYARKPGSRIDFEDAHVVKSGGKLYPHEYEMSRFWFRSGWVLDAGQSVSFLARRGTHTLEFVTGLGAVFELAGRAYHVDPAPGYQRIRVKIPEDGRVTLHCVSGGINLERMEHESR
ncbi:MAG TPA: hypothetical protein VE010_03195, partial [Thermoanaerobaculia bacterium]|nr:hypothetical protein [Thermoanaerobaculia bacterium]